MGCSRIEVKKPESYMLWSSILSSFLLVFCFLSLLYRISLESLHSFDSGHTSPNKE